MIVGKNVLNNLKKDYSKKILTTKKLIKRSVRSRRTNRRIQPPNRLDHGIFSWKIQFPQPLTKSKKRRILVYKSQ